HVAPNDHTGSVNRFGKMAVGFAHAWSNYAGLLNRRHYADPGVVYFKKLLRISACIMFFFCFVKIVLNGIYCFSDCFFKTIAGFFYKMIVARHLKFDLTSMLIRL